MGLYVMYGIRISVDNIEFYFLTNVLLYVSMRKLKSGFFYVRKSILCSLQTEFRFRI